MDWVNKKIINNMMIVKYIACNIIYMKLFKADSE